MESPGDLNEQDEKKRRDDEAGRSGLRWMGAGIEFCAVIAIFCYFGYKLDEYFGTGPFLMLTGFFIGFIGMVYLFYKESK